MKLRRRPALPKSREASNWLEADAAHLVRDRALERERVVDQGDVGPDDELIEVVGVRAIELARDLHDVELQFGGEPLADGAAAAAGGIVAQVDGRELARAAWRDADNRFLEVHLAELHLDHAARQERELGVHGPGRLEAPHAAPGHRVSIGRGVGEHASAGGRVEVGEKGRDTRRPRQEP